jgi:hypothetical protein
MRQEQKTTRRLQVGNIGLPSAVVHVAAAAAADANHWPQPAVDRKTVPKVVAVAAVIAAEVDWVWQHRNEG